MFGVVAAAAAVGLCGDWETNAARCVRQYNVEWDSLLAESESTWVNTLPVGNGREAANVWYDGAGTVSLLLASQEAWNEAGQLMKLGRVEVAFSPAPAAGSKLNVTLDVATGAVEVTAGPLHVSVWIDANGGAAVVDYSSDAAGAAGAEAPTATVKVLPIRTEAQSVKGQFECTPFEVSADVVAEDADGVAFYHRNSDTLDNSYFARMCTEQNLGDECYKALPDVLRGRTSGGYVVQSAGRVVVQMLTKVTGSGDEFVAAVKAAAQAGRPSRAAHNAWWASFWGRGHIEVSDPAVSAKLVQHRYLQGCQGRAPFPIKFNGMLFTAQKPPHEDDRQWGGRNWWQNARLPYYNMFATGDFDMLEAFLQSYLRTLPVAKLRAQHYYNVTGAFWEEYNDALFGTTHSQSYGCGRAGKTSPPFWYNEDRWNHYNRQGTLDLALFGLDFAAHTGKQTFLPIAADVLAFYAGHYTQRSPGGKMVIYPTQAIETYQCPGYPPNKADCATNDLPTIAGLQAVATKLLQTTYGSPQQRAAWKSLLAALPDLPGEAAGKLTPCEACPSQTSNVENPELYAVHPYRLFTVGRGVSTAAATTAFAHKTFKSDDGWNQNILDAALLGDAANFKSYAEARAGLAPAKGYRFPAFMPHLQDYPPSADHLSNLLNGVTYALLQEDETAAHKLVLLPAWPCSWDVDFKLHAPLNTTITGSLRGGVVQHTVQPPSRSADVRVASCQKV